MASAVVEPTLLDYMLEDTASTCLGYSIHSPPSARNLVDLDQPLRYHATVAY